jgi:hypothetical protein
VFGNSVAVARFPDKAAELRIESVLHLERYGLARPVFELEADAAEYPFVYSSEDRADLGRQLERHSPDPSGAIEQWAKGFVASKPTSTLALARGHQQHHQGAVRLRGPRAGGHAGADGDAAEG